MAPIPGWSRQDPCLGEAKGRLRTRAPDGWHRALSEARAARRTCCLAHLSKGRAAAEARASPGADSDGPSPPPSKMRQRAHTAAPPGGAVQVAVRRRDVAGLQLGLGGPAALAGGALPPSSLALHAQPAAAKDARRRLARPPSHRGRLRSPGLRRAPVPQCPPAPVFSPLRPLCQLCLSCPPAPCRRCQPKAADGARRGWLGGPCGRCPTPTPPGRHSTGERAGGPRRAEAPPGSLSALPEDPLGWPPSPYRCLGEGRAGLQRRGWCEAWPGSGGAPKPAEKQKGVADPSSHETLRQRKGPSGRACACPAGIALNSGLEATTAVLRGR
uniref:Uncharacterized protein n=1 Tax=Sphaerodactylus townsendi TaxID=933632 RepID=A0ACB8FR49_9SAUR